MFHNYLAALLVRFVSSWVPAPWWQRPPPSQPWSTLIAKRGLQGEGTLVEGQRGARYLPQSCSLRGPAPAAPQCKGCECTFVTASPCCEHVSSLFWLFHAKQATGHVSAQAEQSISVTTPCTAPSRIVMRRAMGDDQVKFWHALKNATKFLGIGECQHNPCEMC